MGTFISSSSLPADVHEEARERLFAWLEVKGFEALPDVGLFDDLDRDHERGAVILWNERWTVLLYSHPAEEERLRFELRSLGLPVVHLFCRSGGWGWALHAPDDDGDVRVVSAFSSDPRDEPNGPDDLAVLARVLGDACGSSISTGALESARRRRSGSEDATRAFAETLGVPAAASSYHAFVQARAGDGEGEGEVLAAAGFAVERHVFRHRDHDPMADFDLHAVRATAAATPPPANDWAALADSIGTAEARRLRRLTVLARWLSGAMRVLETPWVLLHRARLALRHRRHAASLRESFRSQPAHPGLRRPPDRPELRVGEGWIENLRHDLRLAWSDDADVAAADLGGVLPVRLGEIPVVCRALRGAMARRMLTGRVGEIEAEEVYRVGEWPAKRVRSRLPQVDPPLVLEEHYVQTPRAVYVFGVGPSPGLDEDLPMRLRRLIEGLGPKVGPRRDNL